MSNLHRNKHRILLLLGAVFFIFASTYAFACTLFGEGLSSGVIGQAGASHCSHLVLEKVPEASDGNLQTNTHGTPAAGDNCCPFYPDILRKQDSGALAPSLSEIQLDQDSAIGLAYAIVPEVYPSALGCPAASAHPQQIFASYSSVISLRRAGRSPPLLLI